MKPSVRRRVVLAPFRVPTPTLGPSAALWTPREKKQLLRLLQARAAEQEPATADLGEGLAHQSEAEIQSLMQLLKRLVAREVIRQEHRCGQKKRKLHKAEVLAPTLVCTDMAAQGPNQLEEGMITAFSQNLTIADTEPVSLLHSFPEKPTEVGERQLLCKESCSQQQLPPQALEPTQETSGGVSGTSDTQPKTDSSKSNLAPPKNGNSVIDFEKIHKYLLSVSGSGSGKGLELSSGESAVLLNLFTALPEELGHLPCQRLQAHMASSYRKLKCPQANSGPSPGDPGQGPWVEDSGMNTSTGRAPEIMESPTRERPAASGPSVPPAQHQLWAASGVRSSEHIPGSLGAPGQ